MPSLLKTRLLSDCFGKLAQSTEDLNKTAQELVKVLRKVGWRVQGRGRHFSDGVRCHHPKYGGATVVCKNPEDWLSVLVRLDNRETFMQVGALIKHEGEWLYCVDVLDTKYSGWRVISPLELLAECADG